MGVVVDKGRRGGSCRQGVVIGKGRSRGSSYHSNVKIGVHTLGILHL